MLSTPWNKLSFLENKKENMLWWLATTKTYLDDDMRRNARTDPIIPMVFGRALINITVSLFSF
jgi:hypothetical protein